MISPRKPKFEIARLSDIPPQTCVCGESSRAFQDHGGPGTLHYLDVSIDTEAHYHKQSIEMYYFLQCAEGAQMEMDGKVIDVEDGDAIYLNRGCVHRAIGLSVVLVHVFPGHNPKDEYFDTPNFQSDVPWKRVNLRNFRPKDTVWGLSRSAFAELEGPAILHHVITFYNTKPYYTDGIVEMCHVIKSTGAKLEVEGEQFPIEQNDRLWIEPGVAHRIVGNSTVLIADVAV